MGVNRGGKGADAPAEPRGAGGGVVMYLYPTGSSMEGYHQNFGVMTAPAMKGIAAGIREGRRWACDNEVYTRWFESARFFGFLKKLQPYRATMLFSVCVDAVGDARTTLELYRRWAHQCRRFGPVAFVAQDGQESLDFPPAFDWLFIGGTTDWKMSDAADDCIRRAKVLGKPVHVGRVNSITRFRHFQLMEVDSVDGTFPIYEPDTARRRLLGCVAQDNLLSLL